MVLVHAAALLIIIVISVIFLGRFFAKVVEILAHYFARVDVTIDTFGLFSVRGIKIKLNGQRTLIIESISLQTKWTYSNSRKVFTILFGKVELIQDVQVGSQAVKDKAKKSNSIIASHSERVSQIVNLLCQYLAISFCDISFILKLPRDRLMQCELRQGLDLVANPNGRWLNCLMSAKKIETQITTTNRNGLRDTLVKLTVEFIVEASLQPLQGIKSADVQVTLHSVCAVINDGFLINNINSPSPDTRTEPSLNEGNALSSNSELTRDIWLQLANIPKHMQVHSDKICISFVNRDQRNLRLDISQVVTIFEQKETEDDTNKQCDVNLVISGVTATGVKSCELCMLNRLRFTSKIYEYNSSTHVGASVCIESLHNNYVHDECLYWLEYLKSRLREKKEDKRSLTGYKSNRGIEFKLPVKVDVEMIDCSTCLFLNHERADQPLCRAVLASCVVNIDIPRMVVDTDNASHRIRMETRLENAYIYFDALKTLPESFDSIDTTSYTLPDNPSLLPNTNNHVWGRTLAMGTFALQCDVEMPALDNKPVNVRMKAEASCLSVEWSHQVCTAILHLSKQFTTTTAMATTRKINNETPNRTKICMDTEIRLRGVNIFYLGTRESGVDSFVYRTDMVVVTIPVTEPASLEAFGLNISRMVGLKRAAYKCHLSRDILDPCLSVPVITASLTKDKIISCSVNDTLVNWDPTLHMALNDRIQEITQDIASVKGIFMRKIESEERKAQKTNSTVMTHIKCEISAFKLDMKTSSSTRFGVQFAKSNINLQANDLSVVIETAAVLFDNNNTFSFENVKLQRSSQMEEVQNVRKVFVNLTTTNNITWIISAQETRVCFPHQFDFASSRSELVNIAKMLKTLHRKPHDSSDTGSLPPDLWLRFGKIIFEIEDDPFEVKLGVNYTLLLDEAKHWSDRMETLQNRLKTIRMTPGNSLTVQKEIMLHKKLLEKNAELYIQRSKAFYHEFPMRTSLLTWEIEGLDLMVLADESYHGKHKAVETMMTLNTERYYFKSGIIK